MYGVLRKADFDIICLPEQYHQVLLPKSPDGWHAVVRKVLDEQI